MNTNNQKLKELLETRGRHNNESEERERQANVQINGLNGDLKMAKDEVKRFSSMVLQRESRYSHEAKKRDQEIAKLKDRLLKVMTVDTKLSATAMPSIEIVGSHVSKEGKTRGRWKNEANDQVSLFSMQKIFFNFAYEGQVDFMLLLSISR